MYLDIIKIYLNPLAECSTTGVRAKYLFILYVTIKSPKTTILEY